MTMKDMKCEVCGRDGAIGVASTSIPLSVAFCMECARRGADPEIVFEFWASEGITPDKHASPDHSNTYKDGKYMTYREWYELTARTRMNDEDHGARPASPSRGGSDVG